MMMTINLYKLLFLSMIAYHRLDYLSTNAFTTRCSQEKGLCTSSIMIQYNNSKY